MSLLKTRWTTVPLGRVVELNARTLPETTDPDFEFRYVDIGSVGRGTLVEEPQTLTFEKSPSRARRVLRPGDTIVSTVRTYLRAVMRIPDNTTELIGSTGFAVLTARPELDSRFLGWFSQSDPFVEEIVARSVGVSYPAISPSDMARLPVAVPDLQTQRTTADFLDAETARIDALIGKKHRMIELLEERFWNWLSDCIRRTAAPTVPLRRALVWITDGPFGSSLTSAHYSDEGARVVRLGNIGMAEFKDEDEAYISAEHYATLLKHRVRAGDLLIAGLGDAKNHVGRGCVAPELGDAIAKADCYCAAVEERAASAEFLALYLASPLGRDAVAYLSRGSTRTRINLDVAKAIPVVLPPQSEQAALVSEAHRRSQAISSLRASLRRQVYLLGEHRQALVTAAVTGQLEIPGGAA